MLKNLSSNDLKSGMVAIDNTGEIAIVLKETTCNGNDFMIYKEGGQLLNKGLNLSEHIKKLYKVKDNYPHIVIQKATEILNCDKENFNPSKFDLVLVYSEPKVIEVTMTQIEEVFGGKVKIIS